MSLDKIFKEPIIAWLIILIGLFIFFFLQTFIGEWMSALGLGILFSKSPKRLQYAISIFLLFMAIVAIIYDPLWKSGLDALFKIFKFSTTSGPVWPIIINGGALALYFFGLWYGHRN